MYQHNPEYFVMENRFYFHSHDLIKLYPKIKNLKEDKFKILLEITLRNPTIALILSIFLGMYGIDRFYIRDYKMGFIKLITLGGFGFWTIYDWFTIQPRTKDLNYKTIIKRKVW